MPVRDIDSDDSSNDSSSEKKSLNNRTIPWARYFARLFDFILVGFICYVPVLIIWGSRNTNITLFQFLIVIPFIYIFFEPFCYVLWGATPGKFLYSIKVLNEDGSKLSLRKAVKRSLQVLIRGNAFGIPFLIVLANFIAFRYYEDNKQTPWDKQLRIKYEIGNINNQKILITNIMILLLSSFLRFIGQYSKDYIS